MEVFSLDPNYSCLEISLTEEVETRKRLLDKNREQLEICERMVLKKKKRKFKSIITVLITLLVGILILINGKSIFLKFIGILTMVAVIGANIVTYDERDAEDNSITMNRLKYRLNDAKKTLEHSEEYLKDAENKLDIFKKMKQSKQA